MAYQYTPHGMHNIDDDESLEALKQQITSGTYSNPLLDQVATLKPFKLQEEAEAIIGTSAESDLVIESLQRFIGVYNENLKTLTAILKKLAASTINSEASTSDVHETFRADMKQALLGGYEGVDGDYMHRAFMGDE